MNAKILFPLFWLFSHIRQQNSLNWIVEYVTQYRIDANLFQFLFSTGINLPICTHRRGQLVLQLFGDSVFCFIDYLHLPLHTILNWYFADILPQLARYPSRMMSASTKTKLKAILIDLSGTLHIDDEPTKNAIAALDRYVWQFNWYGVWGFIYLIDLNSQCRLQQQPNITVRFVTNTTKESRRTLLNRLNRIGFKSITENDMFTSLSAAVQYVRNNNLSPLYLLTDDAKQEFSSIDQCDASEQNAVVVGLAPEQFNYETMNEAFRYRAHNAHIEKLIEVKY